MSQLIDDEDKILLIQYGWQIDRDGYIVCRVKGNSIHLHRLILKTAKQVDHINGNKLDNRRRNLREATVQENARNRKVSCANTSGYKGVSWNSNKGKYKSQIYVSRKPIFLGYFDDVIQAAVAYNEAASKLFGDFANLNHNLESN